MNYETEIAQTKHEDSTLVPNNIPHIAGLLLLSQLDQNIQVIM